MGWWTEEVDSYAGAHFPRWLVYLGRILAVAFFVCLAWTLL